MGTSQQTLIHGEGGEQEWEEGGEEYEDEDDYDAEAEEIAQRLNDQLWADIAKAQAEVCAAAQTAPPSASITPAKAVIVQPPIASVPDDPPPEQSPPPVSSKSKKQEAAIMTMRGILALAYKDSIVRATLAASFLPSSTNLTVLDVLNRSVSTSSVERSLAGPLSDAVVSLAKSETLFSSMRNSDAPAIQLDKGKRKRDATEDTVVDSDRYAKRAAIEYPDLLSQISEAVRVITSAFNALPVSDRPPDGPFVSSIQFQLHQAFLFAVTSAPRARQDLVNALQELGGLIQMVGVLSDIPIGPAPSPWGGAAPAPPPDIGTAVYPCLVPSCHKTFHRLYSLRTHQRLHALVDRPYRCAVCPASFQRNHDLKRHSKLHDKTAWKCGGCGKIFSRRDAIKRHKDARGRGGKGGHAESACALADVEEVEVEKESGEEDASRRAKLWNGIVASQLAGAVAAEVHDDGVMEEGEVPFHVVQRAQEVVMQLHPVLQSRITNALGNTPNPLTLPVHPMAPGHQPHSTLASVIARTQPQYHHLPQPATGGPPSLPPPLPTSATPNAAHDSGPNDRASDTSLSLSWLSEEQTKLLEQAIAQAAAAAQAQAEAEAALEEEEDEEDELEDEDAGDGED